MKYGIATVLLMVSFTCMAEEEFVIDTYVEASIEGLRMQTESHDAMWRITEADNWGVDQDAGEITWSFADGTTVVAPVQIIGTYNPNDGTFMWGWDHPSVQPALQESARLVRQFGEEHQISSFTQQKITIADESEAWEFVAVANRLAESNGGYRGDSGGPLVFMTFGKISISKD